MRSSLLQGPGYSFFGDAPSQIVAFTMFKAAVRYYQLPVFPYLLCPFYDWYVMPVADSLADPEALGGLILLILLVVSAFALWLTGRAAAAFGLAWTVVALLPVSQIVPIINVAAERFLYLPSAGFCLFIAAITRWDKAYKQVILGILLAVFAWRIAARNLDWRDDITLNLAFARDFPQTPTPHINLTRYFAEQGDLQSALRHSETARLLEPRLPGPWEESVRLLIRLNRPAEARKLAREGQAAGIDAALFAPMLAPPDRR